MYFDDLVLVRISCERYQIQQQEYATSGSCPLALWSVDSEFIPEEYWQLTPGTPVFFVCELDGRDYVVGGGFYSRWVALSIEDTWLRFGVRTGSTTIEGLRAEVEERGGASMLNVAIISSSFMFTKAQCKLLNPEMYAPYKEQRLALLHTSDPFCLYLKKVVQGMRKQELDALGQDWPGLYYSASHGKSSEDQGVFFAKVMSAYNFGCAITGTRAYVALDVAHIQPLFNKRFQSVRNGLVLRADVHRLFSQGLISAFYRNEREVEIVVSDTVHAIGAEDYLQYHGKLMQLPLNEKLWPHPGHLDWHYHHCFEHWLYSDDGHHI
ncbi:MAG: HNH endonuclease [Succinivibrionaceae bacterium]|nr:HNH endonuclease [Succinivibrionaceae bacterium]